MDGHLNYYLLNKGKEKYFQKVEEYTGEGVFKYHNFYLPIKVQDKFYIARIVGEEWNDSKGYNPIEINLYDLIIQKKEFIIPKNGARPFLGMMNSLQSV